MLQNLRHLVTMFQIDLAEQRSLHQLRRAEAKARRQKIWHGLVYGVDTDCDQSQPAPVPFEPFRASGYQLDSQVAKGTRIIPQNPEIKTLNSRLSTTERLVRGFNVLMSTFCVDNQFERELAQATSHLGDDAFWCRHEILAIIDQIWSWRNRVFGFVVKAHKFAPDNTAPVLSPAQLSLLEEASRHVATLNRQLITAYLANRKQLCRWPNHNTESNKLSLLPLQQSFPHLDLHVLADIDGTYSAVRANVRVVDYALRHQELFCVKLPESWLDHYQEALRHTEVVQKSLFRLVKLLDFERQNHQAPIQEVIDTIGSLMKADSSNRELIRQTKSQLEQLILLDDPSTTPPLY